jgi:tetratricopeptide (TPR) repeat protein
MYAEAAAALEPQDGQNEYAPRLYHRGYYYKQAGDAQRAAQCYAEAKALSPAGCLHSRPESLLVFKDAIESDASDASAPYYLGNMLYAARQYGEATAMFELSIERGADFPAVYRNLSYGLFRRGETDRAGELIRRAFELDPMDAYVFFDLCQYLRNTYASVEERAALYEIHFALASAPGRDDNYNTMCATYIEAGDYEKARALLKSHNYHSYEGGEGVSVRLHIISHVLPGIMALEAGQLDEALKLFEEAREIPENFREGKRVDGFIETARVFYWLGRAWEALGNSEKAEMHYEQATRDQLAGIEMKYYAAAALRKLGRTSEANAMAAEMLDETEASIREAGSYAYFRSGLMPSYLPYEWDKKRKDMEALNLLRGLALLANDKPAEAENVFEEAVRYCAIDYKSAFVRNHFKMFCI